MATLNYKHLQYFWMIQRAGGVTRASEKLHVTPQSISGQIRLLEQSIGERLFRRSGRSVELTDIGRMVYEYADRMFSTGEELQDALRSPLASLRQQLRVGVSNVVSRSTAFRILQPALNMDPPPRLVCHEGRLADLLADLAVNRLDLVISDRPMDTTLNVRGFNHLLGESGIAFLAAPALAEQLRPRFPRSLHDAPMIFHGEDATLRRRFVRWLELNGIQPRIAAEFDDTALLKAFGQGGAGAFIAPLLVVDEICQQYGVVEFGRTNEVIDQIYAISAERRLTHPAVVTICNAAREVTYAKT